VVISTIVASFSPSDGSQHQNRGVAEFGYIELMRALPSYLIIFYVFIAFPKIGINLAAPWFAIIGLSLYTSAVMAEIFRAGILSVEKGQFEAAYALGLKPRHTVIHIVFAAGSPPHGAGDREPAHHPHEGYVSRFRHRIAGTHPRRQATVRVLQRRTRTSPVISRDALRGCDDLFHRLLHPGPDQHKLEIKAHT